MELSKFHGKWKMEISWKMENGKFHGKWKKGTEIWKISWKMENGKFHRKWKKKKGTALCAEYLLRPFEPKFSNKNLPS